MRGPSAVVEILFTVPSASFRHRGWDPRRRPDSWARRGERRLRTALFALPLIGAVWLAVDFVTKPEGRWLNGITLALAALVAAGAFGYQWLQKVRQFEIARATN